MATTIVFLLLVCQSTPNTVDGLQFPSNLSTILHALNGLSSDQEAAININDDCRFSLTDNSSVRCKGIKTWYVSDPIIPDIINLDLLNWKSLRIECGEFCNGTGTCPKNLKALRVRDSWKLAWIQKGAFDGLDNLSTLIITNTRIKRFIPHFFIGLNNVKRLELTSNRIRFIRNVDHDGSTSAQDILPALETLALDGNPLWTIDDGFFSTFNTDKVTKISMRSCNLINIGNQSFCTLKSLQVLDLHDNPNIVKLVSDAFQCTQSNGSGLATLSLSKNKIKSSEIVSILQGFNATLTTVDLNFNRFRVVKSTNFPIMRWLGILTLNFCKISHIMSRAFVNLVNLKELHLQGNHLTTIPVTMNAPNLLYLNLDKNFAPFRSRRNSTLREKIENYFVLPESIPNLPKLRKLTMNWLRLKTFPRKALKGLYNLTTLEIKHTPIREIEDYTFEETPRLTSLDLSGSHKLVIKSNNVFSGLFRLKHLNLSKYSYFKHFLSEIDKVEKTISAEFPFQNLFGLSHLDLTGHDLRGTCGTFLWGLFRLESLILSSTNMTTWKAPLFNFFPILREIDLSFNDIENLTKEHIEDLRSLDTVNFAFNPLDCSCAMLESLHNLINEHNVSVTHIDSHVAYRCEVDDKSVSLVEAQQYYSKPCFHTDKSSYWTFHYIVLLAPILAAVAAAIVIWRRRNLYYISYLFYIKFKKKRLANKENMCTYDAFVCYSEQDGQWLYEEMQRNLETNGIRLCLRERDFILGRSKIENLIDAVERSSKIILVLSRAFVSSRWCLFEADIAQQRLVQDAATNIVVVNLEHVQSKSMPSYLRYLVKTRTHINWPNDTESRPLFWAKLVRSIRKNSVSTCSSSNSVSSDG